MGSICAHHYYISLLHSLLQQPPPPSCRCSGCDGPTPHHLCGSTGTCSSSDCTKLNKLRAEKGHIDPPHYYDQTGGGEGKTMEGIYDEVGEGTGTIGGQREHYQELKLETVEKRQYATPRGEGHQC